MTTGNAREKVVSFVLAPVHWFLSDSFDKSITGAISPVQKEPPTPPHQPSVSTPLSTVPVEPDAVPGEAGRNPAEERLQHSGPSAGAAGAGAVLRATGRRPRRRRGPGGAVVAPRRDGGGRCGKVEGGEVGGGRRRGFADSMCRMLLLMVPET